MAGMPDTVKEYIGFKTTPSGWPVGIGPGKLNPGQGELTEAQDDRIFVHGRDYYVSIVTPFNGVFDPDQSQIVQVYDLLPDNKWETTISLGLTARWAGRHAYVSARRLKLFCEEALGYPFMNNGKLHRKLPEPLRWGGTLKGEGVPPPSYPHNTSDVWMYPDNRGATKILGDIKKDSATIENISTTGFVTSADMIVQGYGIPNNTHPVGKVGKSLTITAKATEDLEQAEIWLYGAETEQLRHTHWATRILRIEPVGELGQCADAGAAAIHVEINGTVTLDSAVITNVRMLHEPRDGDIAANMYVVGTGIQNDTKIDSITRNGNQITSITMTKTATASGSEIAIGISGNLQGWPANQSYKRIRVHVAFTTPNYNLFLRSDEKSFAGEFSRFCIWAVEPSGRFIQARGSAVWDADPAKYGNEEAAAQPLVPGCAVGALLPEATPFAGKEGLPTLQAESTIIARWTDVPRQAWNPSRCQAWLGSINSIDFPLLSLAPYMRFNKHTLLFRSYGFVEKRGILGPPVFDITFYFTYSPGQGDRGAWVRLLSPLGFYQRYKNKGTGKTYFPEKNFADLFKP